MKRFFILLFFLAFFPASYGAHAETSLSFCINEVCSDNSGHYTTNGSSPDYIELCNLTDQIVPLDGFFISDDEDHLASFSLDGYVIPENGYLILAADKKELPFKLSASAGEDLYLVDREKNIAQHVILPPLEKDTTYSLQKNGDWQITEPTPQAENVEGVPYIKKVFVASPRFSHPAGFYDEPIDLLIESYSTYKVYYTTDGSIPDEHSKLYSGPIHIEDATSLPNSLSARTDITVSDALPPSDPVKKGTIIRAVAIDPNGNRSNDVANTYFVGFQDYEAYKNIAVLSIVADPYDLFDNQDGIYVRGKTYQAWLNDEKRDKELIAQKIPTNYRMRGKEWEIPVDIQWFDEENALCLSQGAGLRIQGNWSRESAKKSFSLYARKEYGASAFQYDILEDFPNKKKLVVRSKMGKDSSLHALLRSTGLPVSSSTPCIVFINGEFWGIYELREKLDENDIADFFGLSAKDLLVFKNNELIAGTPPKEIKNSVYRDLLAKISSLDLSTAKGYEAVDELIDVENYITYTAGIVYLNNSDYRSNFTIWRTVEKSSEAYADGRWRWIFQDLDNCCLSYEGATETISFLPEDTIFSSLWKNKVFQTQFLTRIMDFANIELVPDYVQEFITPRLTYYNPYLYETNVRFSSKDTSTKPGTKTISSLMAFFQTRRKAVIKQLTDTFQLTRGTSTLSLNGLAQGFAITINGHHPHLYGDSWTGVYFKGCTVSFSAGDVPGCKFIGWYEGDELITAEQIVEISTDTDRTLTPLYEELPVIVLMNETDKFYNNDGFSFTKRLTNSLEECEILPDASVKAERKYTDSSIIFQLDASVDVPQGFTLTIPLLYYKDVGGYFMLSVPDNYSSGTWKLYCKNADSSFHELPLNIIRLTGGLLRLSFTVPEDQIDFKQIEIRLEVEQEKGLEQFSLSSLRLYGIPLDTALVNAYEYAKMAKAIDAEAEYFPDFVRMADWSAERVEAETIALREKLQIMMAENAVSTVGKLCLFFPALEGLELFPAAVIDDKLVEAFYNKAAISLHISVGKKVYLYEVTDNSLILQGTVATDGTVISLNKRPGTYIFLDQPVEDIRFHVAFDTDQIPTALLSGAFHDIKPQNHLWMNVETFTQYQEEVSFDLSEKWFNQSVFIYLLQGDDLVFVEESSAADCKLLFTPVAGKYLMLENPIEQFEEEADLLQNEIDDMKQLQALETQKIIKLRIILILIGCAIAAVVIGRIVFTILARRKGR